MIKGTRNLRTQVIKHIRDDIMETLMDIEALRTMEAFKEYEDDLEIHIDDLKEYLMEWYSDLNHYLVESNGEIQSRLSRLE